MGVSIVAMPLCASPIKILSYHISTMPGLVVTHNRDLVTLYCTLSHFSTLFGLEDPAVNTCTQGGKIYFTLSHTIDQKVTRL